MRVASIAFTHYASDARVRRMAEALAGRGDDVDALTLRDEGEPKRYSLADVTIRTIGISQHRGSNPFLYVAQYVAFAWVVAWILLVRHIRQRFDVIHVNNMPDFIVFAALPVKLLGAKVILDIHDPMPELFEIKFGVGPRHPLVRLIGWVERMSIRFADEVISVHDVQKETFVSRGTPPDRFTIVQNVADPRYFPIGTALTDHQNGDTVLLVYHGTMAPRLGLDLLLHALAQARTDVPNLRLQLIGDGDDTPRLLALIDALDLHDAVDFEPGFIPVEDLLPRLAASDIGVVPANVNAFTRNMLPVKLLEYVTIGVPSISTDLPAVRRYFEEGEVLLVPPGDTKALAEAVILLAGDPDLRRLQAKRAMSFVERHSWEGEKARYLSLVDRLAATGTDRGTAA